MSRQTPLGFRCPEADSRKGALDGIGRAYVLPVLGRDIVEGEQAITVLDQAVCRFIVLGAISLDEEAKRRLGIGPGLGHPDILNMALGLALRKRPVCPPLRILS